MADDGTTPETYEIRQPTLKDCRRVAKLLAWEDRSAKTSLVIRCRPGQPTDTPEP